MRGWLSDARRKLNFRRKARTQLPRRFRRHSRLSESNVAFAQFFFSRSNEIVLFNLWLQLKLMRSVKATV